MVSDCCERLEHSQRLWNSVAALLAAASCRPRGSADLVSRAVFCRLLDFPCLPSAEASQACCSLCEEIGAVAARTSASAFTAVIGAHGPAALPGYTGCAVFTPYPAPAGLERKPKVRLVLRLLRYACCGADVPLQQLLGDLEDSAWSPQELLSATVACSLLLYGARAQSAT